MVAQLDSLIWVVVLFMMDKMDQVSLKMELSGTFNNSFQNSKKLFLSLIDLDILTCRVLPILWNNSSWGKYKSWNWCVGEEHARSMQGSSIFDNALTMLVWSLIIH
jgi:hypothetical protein